MILRFYIPSPEKFTLDHVEQFGKDLDALGAQGFRGPASRAKQVRVVTYYPGNGDTNEPLAVVLRRCFGLQDEDQ